MNKYATYEFYRDIFQGKSIEESEFDGVISKASAFLDGITFGRIKDVTEDLSAAACAAAEEMSSIEAAYSNSAGGSVAAEKTGDQSITYNTSGVVEPNSREAYKRIRAAAMLYIKDKRLLERWCGA